MSWWNSLLGGAKSAASSLGSSIQGSFSALDASGGWSTYSATQSLRKDQMEREISMAKHFAKYGPSWTMEGLKKAGINPILAADSVNSWSGLHGSLGGQAQGGGSSIGFKSKLDRDTTKKLQENIDADTTLKAEQGKAALVLALAALELALAAKLNAINSSKRVDAEVELMRKQGAGLDVRNPNESAWGVSDRILGYSGDLLHSAGTAAAIYGVAKSYADKNRGIYTIKDLFGTPHSVMKDPKTGLVIPAYDSLKPVKAVNSGKSVVPVLMNIGKGAAIATGVGGAVIYGTKANKNNHLNKKVNKEMKEKGKDSWHSYFDPGFGF